MKQKGVGLLWTGYPDCSIEKSPPVFFDISVGDVGVASSGAGGPAACFEKLGKEGLAAGWAVDVQAKMIWLVSGATGRAGKCSQQGLDHPR